MNKIISLFLILAVLFSFASLAYAEETPQPDGGSGYEPPSLTDYYTDTAAANANTNNAVGTVISYMLNEVTDGNSIGYDLAFDQTTAQINNQGVADMTASTGATVSINDVPTQIGDTVIVGNTNQAPVDGMSALTLYMDPSIVTDANGNFDNNAYRTLENLVEQSISKLQHDGRPVNEANINSVLQSLCEDHGIDGNVFFRENALYNLNGQAAFDSEIQDGMMLAIMGYHNMDDRISMLDLSTNFHGEEINYLNAMINAIEMGLTEIEYNGKTLHIDPQIYELMQANKISVDQLWEYLAETVINRQNTDLLVLQNLTGPYDPNRPHDDDDPDIPPPKPQGYDILASMSTTPIPYSHMTPTPSASITAANDTGHNYDCSIAIPTSENLNYKGSSDDVLYDIVTRQHNLEAHTNGALTMNAAMAYHWITYHWETDYEQHWNIEKHEYEWVPAGGHWEPDHNYEYHYKSDTYSYSTSKTFYDVLSSNIYGLSGMLVKAVREKYTLAYPNGAPIPVSYGGPKPGAQPITPYANSKNVYRYNGVRIVDSEPNGTHDAVLNGLLDEVRGWIRSACESAIGATGNCNYNFKALSVTKTSHNRTDPGWQIISGTYGPDKIPSNYMNGTYYGSASATYDGGRSFGAACNNVIIHTPVITEKVEIVDKNFINQKVGATPTDGINYLQLDEGFTIKIYDSGTHNNYPGYKYRKYNTSQAVPKQITNWGAIKDVKMPFDVYVYSDDGKDLYFLQKDEWLSDYVDRMGIKDRLNYEKSREAVGYRFLVPVWAPEGEYKGENAILVRVVAENVIENGKRLTDRINKTELNKNSNIENYVSIRQFPVEVIGKVYDLQINEDTDVDWKGNLQSLGYTTGYVRANEFPFGRTKAANTTISGKAPVNPSQNKNTAYQYAPKLGYTFVFNFKTKGRKSENVDIHIANDFYFVAKAGGDAVKTALYYKGNDGNYKKITKENAANLAKLGVSLNNKFMGVQPGEMTSSSNIYPKELVPNTPYNYALNVNIGNVAKLNLPHNLRLVYDNFREYATDNGGRGLYRKTRQGILNDIALNNSISKNYPTFKLPDEQPADLVVGSVGHWYAGYALPSTTVAVNPDMITGKTDAEVDRMIKANTPNLQYRTGYILVKFGITTRTKDKQDYLKYTGPEMLNNMGEIPNKDDKETQNPPIPGKQWTDSELDWESNGFVPIILPSGTPANIPQGAVALYETDYSATVDNNSVLAQ